MSLGWTAPDLRGKVAVITGATRGVGLGIAQALGETGATVIVVGRSTRAGGRTEDLPGTVEDAAAAVDAAGGKGVPIACDVFDAAQVEQLFTRVAREQGRLDIVVANAWAGYEQYDAGGFSAPFWEQSIDRWDRMQVSLKGQFLAARAAARLMLPQRSGLLVLTSAGDGAKYRGTLPYDVTKTAAERLAWAAARELRPHGITALALLPGFTRTERVSAAFKGDAKAMERAGTHSAPYVGRAVAMLAADPRVAERAGKAWMCGELAQAYGFADIDGRVVPPFRLPDELA